MEDKHLNMHWTAQNGCSSLLFYLVYRNDKFYKHVCHHIDFSFPLQYGKNAYEMALSLEKRVSIIFKYINGFNFLRPD